VPLALVEDIAKHARITINKQKRAFCSDKHGHRLKFELTRLALLQWIANEYKWHWRSSVSAWKPGVDPAVSQGTCSTTFTPRVCIYETITGFHTCVTMMRILHLCVVLMTRAAFWRALESGTACGDDSAAPGCPPDQSGGDQLDSAEDGETQPLPMLAWGDLPASQEALATLRALGTQVALVRGRVPTPLRRSTERCPSLGVINTVVTCLLASFPAVDALVRLAKCSTESTLIGSGRTQSGASLLTAILSVAVAGNPLQATRTAPRAARPQPASASTRHHEGVAGFIRPQAAIGSKPRLRKPFALDHELRAFVPDPEDLRAV
jgi:hypothetical protein